MPFTTLQQSAVELIIDGRAIPGPFRAYEGGGVTADDGRINPGHMLSSVARGGPPTTGSIVLRRADDPDVMTQELVDWLESRVNSGQATVTRLFLDRNKVPFRRRARGGLLVGFEHPDYDADSSETAQFTFTIAVDGP